MTVTWNHLQKKSRGGLCWGCQVSLPAARIKEHKGRTLAESGDEPTGPCGFSDSIQGCSISIAIADLHRCSSDGTADPSASRPALLWTPWSYLTPLGRQVSCHPTRPCWLPVERAAVTHADSGGDFFISSSSFSGRATGESALNLSVMLLTFYVFRAADWSNCSLTT